MTYSGGELDGMTMRHRKIYFILLQGMEREHIDGDWKDPARSGHTRW